MNKGTIDTASIVDLLWHEMRQNLASYAPKILETELLMCCACGRFLPRDQFNLEHLIPLQAVADDPTQIKIQTTANERSKNILLCKKPLSIRGIPVYPQGCNSWKGSFYDKFIRQFLNGSVFGHGKQTLNVRHTIAMLSLAYLAMFREYGYQIALTPSGILLRKQFFSPNKMLRQIPDRSQMVLFAQPLSFDQAKIEFWSKPFSFNIDRNFCIVVIKNISIALPISRNPYDQILRYLVIKPSKYTLRPDFNHFFD